MNCSNPDRNEPPESAEIVESEANYRALEFTDVPVRYSRHSRATGDSPEWWVDGEKLSKGTTTGTVELYGIQLWYWDWDEEIKQSNAATGSLPERFVAEKVQVEECFNDDTGAVTSRSLWVKR